MAKTLPAPLKKRLREVGRLVFKLTIPYRKLTWRSRMQPDFLIVGAMKCGTTSLHYYLAQHPQLVPASVKEVHFFDVRSEKNDNFKKGEAWYRAHFPRPTNANQHAFESTPRYIFYPPAAERIFTCNSRMKIIILLRNPTERAISHYFHARRVGKESLPIMEALQADHDMEEPNVTKENCNEVSVFRPFYLRRGLYAQQIKRFLSYFPQEQILILDSEDLFGQTRQTVRQVFEFVGGGVDTEFEVKDIAPHHTAKNKVAVDPEVRQYLDHYFLPYNEELYQLIGRNFGW